MSSLSLWRHRTNRDGQDIDLHGGETVKFRLGFGGFYGRSLLSLFAMKITEPVVFPPFQLDLANEQLWREQQLVPLPPKTFAVLRYLVEHAGRLVTKDELLKAVWSDTRVSDGVVKGYIHDLREALGDSSQQPRFIETVSRRGHRFIGKVASRQHSVVSREEEAGDVARETSPLRPPILSSQPLAPFVVGRDAELAHLQRLFEKALTGERQVVFVTGEPGIGKTTLVETFLHGLSSEWVQSPRSKVQSQGSEPVPTPQPFFSSSQSPTPSPQPLAPSPWLGRGQCVEQHGAGEAYLPVLEALGRIGREPSGEQFVAILHQYAPTWLVQMPALIAAEELESVQRRVLGATRERMLREMIESIEILATHRPLVLWFEDLHWADVSTVEWLAAIAQRRASARLLVIGSYRPSDLTLSDHPLKAVKQELVVKGQCEELALPFLSAEDITLYLTRRYPQHQFPAGLGEAIHRSTDGNSLFVVNMVDYLAAQGVIAERGGAWRLQIPVAEVGRGVPESLRQLIEKHIDRLSEEQQQLLEVASVAGVTFATTAVAIGAEAPVARVEECCDELVKRGQFLQAREPRRLPDGTLCGTYGFSHALQRAVLYERIPRLRRLRLHLRVAEGEERLHGGRAQDIAAELAVHFERGGDLHRAVHYQRQAGHNALRQHGYQEAIAHFTRGLDLLATFPDTPDRRQQELDLQVALGAPLLMTRGYAAPDVARAYARARELCQQIGEQPNLFPALVGLTFFYLVRAELRTARTLAEQCLRLAQSAGDPALLVVAHATLGLVLFYLGELTAAQATLEQGRAFHDPQKHGFLTLLYGQDQEVLRGLFASWTWWFLGYPDRALGESQDSLSLARERSHAYSVALALHAAAWLGQYRQEAHVTQEYAQAELALARQEGFNFWLAVGTIQRGWALSEQGQVDEGLTRMREGLDALTATGAELARTYHLALVAQGYAKRGYPRKGWRCWCRRWPRRSEPKSGITRRRSIGSKANSSCNKTVNRQKPKHPRQKRPLDDLRALILKPKPNRVFFRR